MAVDNFGQSNVSFAHDALIAGDGQDISTIGVTIVSGTVALTRGALLGQLTAGGKWGLFANAAVTGLQTPQAILAEAADASGGDKVALVYLTGEFNEFTVSAASGAVASNSYSVLTADQQTAAKDTLHKYGIILKQNMRIA